MPIIPINVKRSFVKCIGLQERTAIGVSVHVVVVNASPLVAFPASGV